MKGKRREKSECPTTTLGKKKNYSYKTIKTTERPVLICT